MGGVGKRRRAQEAVPGTEIPVCIECLCECLSLSVYPSMWILTMCVFVRVAFAVSLLLHVRRSCGRHRIGDPPLSDPLTAVGIEAPALTANVSHIPGLEPVFRRFRPFPVRPMDRTEISVADNRKPRLLYDTYSLLRSRQELFCEDSSRC